MANVLGSEKETGNLSPDQTTRSLVMTDMDHERLLSEMSVTVRSWPTSAAQKIQAKAPYSQFALNKLSQAPRGLEEKES